MEVNRTYNVATSIYFPLVTAGGTAFQATWTPAAAECQVSIDGGAFANSNNTPAHEGNGIWSLAVDAAELQGSVIVVSLSDSSTDIEDQAIIITTNMGGQVAANLGIVGGTVDTATFTATTTALEGTRTFPNTTEETTADHFNGGIILFTSGDLIGIKTDITDYVLANSKEKYTYTAITDAPANGDTYVIL